MAHSPIRHANLISKIGYLSRPFRSQSDCHPGRHENFSVSDLDAFYVAPTLAMALMGYIAIHGLRHAARAVLG